ncbi:MTAP family purine nucleoside phosphorylase [Humisphaera borealis]|uniref:Purine nucleoside phosphorylase n=1 Tax=Humisphaera borealis TaxID=2807512 RepID=A0A7M2WSY8_9BACT|nr:MTAP family purine nucleoside phosphorylase [Humisphaera borealis]QOV87931.1 MTAP family purine nucleoside phosphorylase [Humisphaera borealis]
MPEQTEAATRVRIGIIGGSGLGQALAGQVEGIRHEVSTPFGKPSDAILEVPLAGTSVFLLSRHGPGHVLNPSAIPFRANIFAMKSLGVTHIIASGAVGSLREEFRPRDLVVADQIIDKTCKRSNTFYEHAAVHTEFAEPFCPVMRRILIDTGKEVATDPDQHLKIHDRACYVCMEGPAFSTRAESLMHRLWGGDLIGMTAMPEAKLAREAEIGYALVALVTDYDCWKQAGLAKGPGQKPEPAAPHADPSVLLKEIIANLKSASDNGIRLIKAAVARIAGDEGLQSQLLASPACSSLALAIWSDKDRIPRDQVELLSPLWMKYFR